MRGHQRRKILYVITKSVWGGAQRYVYDLSTRLPRDEFDVAVVSGGAGPLGNKLAAAGIRVISIPPLQRDIGVLRDAVSFFSLLRVIFREKPDIVHLSSAKAGGIGAVAARLVSLATGHRSLVVFTVHGWPFGEPRPAWQRMIIAAASWASTLFQDVVILIAAGDRRAAERFVPRRKLAFIAHGVPPIPFLPRPEARAALADFAATPLPEDMLLAGTIAELTRNKGIRYLIDAIHRVKSQIPNSPEGVASRPYGAGKFQKNPNNQIPKLQTVIIGEGELRRDLERSIQALGLAETIHLLGFVPDASRYLAAFDLFVLPSLKEGLPYGLMEAMAAGLPVVATNVGGIPDLIEDGVNGRIVPPQNPETLGRAIAELLQNPTLGRERGNRARETILRSFNMERMLERTLAIYRNR